MMAMLEVAHGTKPMNSITAAARIRPAGRNTRGFERSDTDPIMNFEKPYAMEIPDSANPRSPREKPCSTRYGMASAKFLRTR